MQTRGEAASLLPIEAAPRGRPSSAERLQKEQRSTSNLKKKNSQSPPIERMLIEANMASINARLGGKGAMDAEFQAKKTKSKSRKEAKDQRKAEPAEKTRNQASH